MSMMLELALKVATEAHKGQKDKGGRDYINHPLTVASMCESDEEKIVALLHDVIEDTDVTLEDLKKYGFSSKILEAIDCITKQPGVSYDEYLRKIKNNELARKVKIADMTHNSDISRILDPTSKDYARVEKYKEKIQYLMN
ncbi:HD domain-containing protein [Holdemania massiliensis]|uniref:HD domain-containing protein n=1 Tax=Holdemania massiliensis TaxID=1468449 RepID=UPI001F0668F2|nr:HD domain-containing protein [Holdemania massiliensis]MCH1940021.1 HD domain-containing protein [Holdemania massiliensis]